MSNEAGADGDVAAASSASTGPGEGSPSGESGGSADPGSTPAHEVAVESEPAASEPGREATGGLSLDETFKLLRNRRRRGVIRHLRAEPETSLGELTEQIAAAETGTTPDRLGSKERKRVYISLYQSHLPRLADAGVVEYDRNRGTVRRLPAADTLDRQLDRFETDDAEPTTDPVRYVGIAAGLFVIAGAAGAPPFDAVGAVWWAVAGVLGLCALAAARRRTGRS